MFGWFSKKQSVNEETTNSTTEVNDIIKKYSSEEQAITNLGGQDLTKDLISAAITFADSYFRGSDDIPTLKSAMEDIILDMRKLERLQLTKSENYAKMKKERDSLKKAIEAEEVYITRAQFAKKINDADCESLLIGFSDFKNILETYKYGQVKTLSNYKGSLSERDIDVIEAWIHFSDKESRTSLGRWDKKEVKDGTLDLVKRVPRQEKLFKDFTHHFADGVVVAETKGIICRSRGSQRTWKMNDQILLVNLENFSLQRTGGYSDGYTRIIPSGDTRVKDIVINGIFDPLELPDDEWFGDAKDYATFKLEVLTERDLLVVESEEGYPGIVFFPWCDGIIVPRIMGNDATLLPGKLEYIYQGA